MKKQPIDDDRFSGYRTYRSGSFPAGIRLARITFRRARKTSLSYPMIGFRVVRNKPSEKR